MEYITLSLESKYKALSLSFFPSRSRIFKCDSFSFDLLDEPCWDDVEAPSSIPFNTSNSVFDIFSSFDKISFSATNCKFRNKNGG